MKVYVILGLDAEGNIDTAGGFTTKGAAHEFYNNQGLGNKIAKAVILTVPIQEVPNETPEQT